MKVTERRAALYERYRGLSEEAKQPYFELAKADSERYEREIAEAGVQEKSSRLG